MKLKLTIVGMHCNGCKIALENALKDNKNVISTSVSLENGYAIVKIKEKTKFKTLEKSVKKCGFKCTKIEEM